MTIRNSITALHDELIETRRHLHQYPQTNYEEEYISDYVAQKLDEWNIEHERGWAVTGIIAKIEGEQNTSGKAIGLRADMDALDVTEETGQPWASRYPGKMHACGHDGHTTMLLGAAKYLSENRHFDGTVYLIFQPAEEGGNGAGKMIEEGLFNKHPMQAVYGIHNWPTIPKGQIGLTKGAIMAGVDTLQINIRGQGGHAAMPHKNIDAVVAAAHIITALQTIVSRNVDPTDTAVLSLTNIHGGSGADNALPNTVDITGTVRTLQEDTRQYMERRIGEIVTQTAAALGCRAELSYNRNYDPTINHLDQSLFCAQVAQDLLGEENVDGDMVSSMAAEDFGAMLKQVSGCYIWLGQGEPDQPGSPHSRMLHDAAYDFNDDIIPLGVEYWTRLVESSLPLKK